MAERDDFGASDLRRAWQRAGAAGDHLSDETWEQLACEELTGFERDRAIGHITSCTDCTAAYRLVLEMRREAAAIDPAVAAIKTPVFHDRPARAWWATPWLAGAVATAAVAVWAVTLGPLQRQPDFTNGVARSARTAITVLAPAAGVPFNRSLAWQAVDGATAYRVVGFTVDGTRVFDITGVKETTMTLAPGVVLPAGKYYLQVTALRDAEVLAESPLVPFDAR